MKTNYQRDRIHSDFELQTMINQMKLVSSSFYPQAQRTGNHAFIEFCGLMNEYIQMCDLTLHRNMDFTTCNVHTGNELQAQDFHIKYLAEKFECIFGPLFQNLQHRKTFIEAMGWKDEEPVNDIRPSVS